MRILLAIEGEKFTNSITALVLEEVLSEILDDREKLAAGRVDGSVNTVGAGGTPGP